MDNSCSYITLTRFNTLIATVRFSDFFSLSCPWLIYWSVYLLICLVTSPSACSICPPEIISNIFLVAAVWKAVVKVKEQYELSVTAGARRKNPNTDNAHTRTHAHTVSRMLAHTQDGHTHHNISAVVHLNVCVCKSRCSLNVTVHLPALSSVFCESVTRYIFVCARTGREVLVNTLVV